MDTVELAKKLAEIDAPDKWMESCLTISKEDRAEVFMLAERLWVEKMTATGKLFVHPDVLKQLEEQSWIATDLQKRMIWASILASADGEDSKERFKSIKSMLLKKYGRDWWEDVFQRKTNAWAAKERIRKLTGSDSPSISMLFSNTILFASAAQVERDAALRMIPST